MIDLREEFMNFKLSTTDLPEDGELHMLSIIVGKVDGMHKLMLSILFSSTDSERKLERSATNMQCYQVQQQF